MSRSFSPLYYGEIVASNGSRTLRKLIADVLDPKTFDVFFDFKKCGNHNGTSTNFTLENQGSNSDIYLETCRRSETTNMQTIEGQGFVVAGKNGGTGIRSGGFKILNLPYELQKGKKTFAFRMLYGTTAYVGRPARLIGDNVSVDDALLGVSAGNHTYPYHVFAKVTKSSSGFGVTSANQNYDVGGWFTWFPNGSVITGNVIVTVGSADEPSPLKIYVDGVLAGVCESVTSMQFYLASMACFCDLGASSVEDWANYGLSYFGVMNAELSAEEVAKLNTKLNMI